MSFIVAFVLVLNLATSVFTQESDRSEGPPARENVFVKLFPDCKVFFDAMDNKIGELMDKDEIGYQTCKDPDYPKACFKADAIKTRCAVSEMPSEKCMAQMIAFVQADVCNL
ncbi:uncharacterized protein LOC129987620 [Argiope bruennichi]|uniref:uncharacterized protein LOC129987620 n=1 Tax=Argiope bruennichi TaxID=94029 RepID=UPI00249460B7|nr:uncharacterized protein LOC129987620 [Argiope bruennichi]